MPKDIENERIMAKVGTLIFFLLWNVDAIMRLFKYLEI